MNSQEDKRIIKLNIFGSQYRFKAHENVKCPEEVQDKITKEFKLAITQMPGASLSTNHLPAVIMTALNISQQYIREKNKLDQKIAAAKDKLETLNEKTQRAVKEIIYKNQSDPVIRSSRYSEQHIEKKQEEETNKVDDIIENEDLSDDKSTQEGPSEPDFQSNNEIRSEQKATPENIEKDEEKSFSPIQSAESQEKINQQSVAQYLKKLEEKKNTEIKQPPVTCANVSTLEKPHIDFLTMPVEETDSIDIEFLKEQSRKLEKKLNDFSIQGEVKEIAPGPVITTYEYKPAPGIKISKIVNLENDIALALSALSVRIVAPIPGKNVIGIEVPNKTREIVRIREIIESDIFQKINKGLPLCLGKDIDGNPAVSDLAKMPHLLIAGATGTGKSVCLNSIIISLLYKCSPQEVKLVMIDPKRIELSLYNDIPHLITPVVTDMKKATNALNWAVKEMEQRYDLLAEQKVRNISQYNAKAKENNYEKLPYIVLIIDELADLMMVSSRDVETALARLAQMARAAGIHMILATQRPSVDVLTGVIKANFPTRISFQVSSKIDSRTILDTNGAEALLGNGDMIFLPPGTSKLKRLHGAYISEDEVTNVIEFLKSQMEPEYIEHVTETDEYGAENPGDEEYDPLYDKAVLFVTSTRQASISAVQRHLRIGFNRAARIIEYMERDQIVGPAQGSKPREILAGNFENL